jgi:hypothetical protein
MVIPVKFSGTPTPGTEPDLVLKDSSTLGAVAAIGALFNLIKPLYHTGTNFGLAEAHTVDATTGEDQFIYAWNQAIVGTSSAANVPTAQCVLNFKTNLGGAYKLYMMENTQPTDFKVYPPYANALFLAISDFVTGDSSPVYGRGNAYPFVPVSALTKTNDKLRQQQGLS